MNEGECMRARADTTLPGHIYMWGTHLRLHVTTRTYDASCDRRLRAITAAFSTVVARSVPAYTKL